MNLPIRHGRPCSHTGFGFRTAAMIRTAHHLRGTHGGRTAPRRPMRVSDSMPRGDQFWQAVSKRDCFACYRCSRIQSRSEALPQPMPSIGGRRNKVRPATDTGTATRQDCFLRQYKVARQRLSLLEWALVGCRYPMSGGIGGMSVSPALDSSRTDSTGTTAGPITAA